MQKNEDDTEVTQKTQMKGYWIGDHWVVRITGYCKVCDGECEQKPTIKKRYD